MRELNEEGLVGRSIGGRGQHLIEEGLAGVALLGKRAANRATGVDEEAEGEGQVVVLVEVTDGLRMTVDAKSEICFGEVLNEDAVFVANDHREVDEGNVDGDGGGGGCRGRLLRLKRPGGDEQGHRQNRQGSCQADDSIRMHGV